MDYPVFFTSDLTSSERKISPHWTVAELKKKLEQFTGISPKYQTLQYYPNRSSNEFRVLAENDDSVLVSSLNVEPYSRIHVEDKDPESRLSELLSGDAPAFELSEEDYAKRAASVLQWKKENHLGRYNPQFQEAQESVKKTSEELAKNIHAGQRCRVINIEGERRGVVKFVGKIAALDEGASHWVGVEFDEPVGKNDGSIGNTRVFSGRAGHGSFVRPNKVEVGDFPELDPFSDDEEL